MNIYARCKASALGAKLQWVKISISPEDAYGLEAVPKELQSTHISEPDPVCFGIQRCHRNLPFSQLASSPGGANFSTSIFSYVSLPSKRAQANRGHTMSQHSGKTWEEGALRCSVRRETITLVRAPSFFNASNKIASLAISWSPMVERSISSTSF